MEKNKSRNMKLRSNELRIGNWVKDENQYYQIKGEHLDEDNFPTIQTWEIPLTEEWLLKFGFVSNPYEDRYEKGLLHIECNKTRGVLEFWIEKLPVSLTLKFVHQLQNLYFALTGEELTIKE